MTAVAEVSKQNRVPFVALMPYLLFAFGIAWCEWQIRDYHLISIIIKGAGLYLGENK